MKTNPAHRAWYAVVSVLFLLLASLVAAACSVRTYTLTFVTNGAAEIAPITAEAGEAITPPADPEKEGAVFDGWYTSADFSGDAVEIPATMPAQDITYYAKFTEKAAATATLTLDAGEYGTLSQTSYELEVGANVYDFVADIAPTPVEGLSFGGWYVGNAALGTGVRMPDAGMALTARYTVPYTVEVYLQTTPEGTAPEDYELDPDADVEDGSGFVGDSVDLTSSLRLTGYTVNTELTGSLQLSATGENVYKAYFDLMSYTVYYSNNVPEGVDIDTVQETQRAYYNCEQPVLENPWEIEGYRFAGWSTSPSDDADITYQEGDSIRVTRTTILYACWNRELTDANGGADVLCVLREEPGKIMMIRQALGERMGTYDAGTRYFYFGKNGADNTLPRGRVSADGATFVYYTGEGLTEFAYMQYDMLSGELVSGAGITLDGIDGASYVRAEGEEAVPGTYTPEDGEYLFESADGSVSFYFRLGTYQGEDVFVIRDNVAGSYSSMSGGSIQLFPFIVLDGYGGAVRLNGFSSADMLTGSYERTETDGVYRLTLSDENGTQYEYLNWFGAYNGRNVFLTADGLQGTYTFEMESSAYGAGTMTAVLDGFNSATWTFVPDAGAQTNGNATYTLLAAYQEAGEAEGETVTYGLVRLSVGDVTTYTLRFVLDGSGNYQAELIGDEAGIYSEYNAVSGYTARILLKGDGNASVLFAMTDGSYVALIDGTYQSVAGQEDVCTFTAAEYAEGYEETFKPYYDSFRFRIYADQGVFVMSDGVEGTYTFTLDGMEWELVCNGFGYSEATWGTSSGSTFYTVVDGYDGYQFIRFGYNSAYYYLRVTPGEASGQSPVAVEVFSGIVGNCADLSNRMSEYTERLLLFPDGHAIVRVSVSDTETYDIPGSYVLDEESNGELIIFTAEGTVDAQYDCYQSFVCSVWTISGSYAFCYYVEDEAATLTFRGHALELSGYGIATYQAGDTPTQYRYYFEEDGENTYLCLASFSGSLAYRIRYDLENKVILEEPGTEQGSYYSYLYHEEDGGYYVGDHVLTLDGYGAVSFMTANEEGVYEQTATGTYTADGDVYEIVWEGEAAVGFNAVILSSATLTNGSSVRVYIQGDPENETEYHVLGEDGTTVATFARDQFGRMTYTVGDTVSNASFVVGESTATGQTLLVASIAGESGETVTNIYLVGEDNSLKLTDGRNGSYSYLDGERIYREVALVLDGFGKATYHPEEGEPIEGAYTPVQGTANEYVFESGDETTRFTFMVTSVTVSGQSYRVWLRYAEAWETELTSSDWQYIAVDGYITATLVDFYGNVYPANYTVLWTDADQAESILQLYSTSLGTRYFLVTGKTFTEMKAADNTFIVRDNTLFAYQGNGGVVKIPDGVTAIADSVFFQRTDVTGVDLNQVTTIGDYVFQGAGLTSVSGGAVTSVGMMCFYQNAALVSVTLANLVTVGSYAFAGCGLTEIALGKAESIGSYAFADCTALTSVSLPAVRTVGAYAFAGCGVLSTVSLGEGLASVGDSAFAQSAVQEGASLTLTLAGTTPPEMGSAVFGEQPVAVIQIAVPSAALSDYQAAWTENGYAVYLTAAASE